MNYFFALPLGSLVKHIKQDLLQPLQAIDAEGQLRWTPPENLHITLAYLGSLNGTAAPDGVRGKAMAEARLKSAIALAGQIKLSNFNCDIQSLGFFPDAQSRILALHVKPCPELMTLQQALKTALAEAGIICDDSPYKPHITLARLKHRQQIEGWQLPAYSSCLPVNQFALYASESSNIKGAAKLYQQIAQFTL